MLLYSCTVFLSSFLLFQVQPLISKFILPWFGGTASVWTVCMLFFQTILLVGYGYSHYIHSRYIYGTGRNSISKGPLFLHIGLIIVSLFFLPIAPSYGSKVLGHEDPTFYILTLLLVSIGAPYFLLASTAPLLQKWYSLKSNRDPYFLYALSNLASFLALLSYPFLVEPNFDLTTQSHIWSFCYVGFAILSIFLSVSLLRIPPSIKNANSLSKAMPLGDYFSWILLAAFPSCLLLAITNQACQDIAVFPFLWVIPLSIYLLTFVFCFSGKRLYHRQTFLFLFAISIITLLMFKIGQFDLNIVGVVALYFGLLFCGCMLCHGELYEARPAPENLTQFYLCSAIGGAIGGVFVALVAPHLFSSYTEFPLSIQGILILIFVIRLRTDDWYIAGKKRPLLSTGVLLAISSLALYSSVKTSELKDSKISIRNFYGIVHVVEKGVGEQKGIGQTRHLFHRGIDHGFQYLDPIKENTPTIYISKGSGFDLSYSALKNASLNQAAGLKIGVIGLGIGTVASYGDTSDTFYFYEINPAVVDLAKQEFTFLKNSKSKHEIFLGDGRLVLEEQASNEFDLLFIDAFSGYSIPLHLVTKEALKIYIKHVKEGGVFLFHISNHYIDLSNVLTRLGAEFGLSAVKIENRNLLGGYAASYLLLTKNKKVLSNVLDSSEATKLDSESIMAIFPLWTDNFSNLFSVLK